jgi:hypothetical protein
MSKRPYQFKVFEAFRLAVGSGELQAPNGQIIASSAQSYATRQHAIRSARDVMNAIQTADITCP